MSASSLCSDQGQTNGGMESSIKTVRAEPSLPWEGQQALFCCVTVVSLQFVKGRGGDNLLTAAVCCSVSDLNLCIPGVERSNKAAGACGSRFQTFTSSLKNWCSRVWLLAGKRIFFFLVQRDKNKYLDQELCPASPCLEGNQSQVGTTPTGCSQGGTATDPQRWMCSRAIRDLCSVASAEHTVRTSARPSVTRAAGVAACGPPPYNIRSNHQLTFKYFLKLR